MEKALCKVISALLCVCILALISVNQTVASNLLANGDFESGTLEGWSIVGTCSIESNIVHTGGYSAYVSDAQYNSWISQDFNYPVGLGLIFEGWVYPLKVGWLDATYPSSGFMLTFYNESNMQTFLLEYTWCANIASQNDHNVIFWPMSVGAWNSFSRDVTADLLSAWGIVDFSHIFLYSAKAYYHYSDASPGPFYVDDLEMFEGSSTLAISELEWKPVCPSFQDPSNVTRTSEPTLVTANITETTGNGVLKVQLSYRIDGGEWWNTSMACDLASGLWFVTIPGQTNETDTVEFFIKAFGRIGSTCTSPIYSYQIRHLLLGDINGDGKIDLRDVWITHKNYGKTSP